MSDSSIPFVLITGFLGAGKTSLISHLLGKVEPGLKIGLVENDYAAASPDSQILMASGRAFSLLEVNNGSVFCVCLLGSFIPSLSAFLDAHQPDLLLMEATGLADPIGIAEILTDPRLHHRLYLSSICCVVDALNYRKISRTNTRVQRQLQVADRILVNKADLAPFAVDELMQELQDQYPAAKVETTVYGRTALVDFMEVQRKTAARGHENDHALASPLGRSDIRTFLLRTTRAIAREGLEAFMAEAGPLLVRIKGIVRVEAGPPLLVQHVFQDTRYEVLPDYEGQTELVGLGWGIDNAAFGRRFHQIRKQFEIQA